MNWIQARTAALMLSWTMLPGAALVAEQQPAPSPPKVVAIGDIHGELDGLVSILQETGLVDEDLSWSGGSSILVQTGDMTDRGAGVRQVLDLMMRLQREATQQNGRVEVLLGNHEVMNLLGDNRFVSPEIYGSFADQRSEKRRQTAYKKWRKWLTRWAKERGKTVEITSETKERWMEAHPPGLVEFREAFEPQGLYGRWLLQFPVAVEIDGVFFQHAGLSPDFADMPLSEINTSAREQILEFLHARDAAIAAGALPQLATLGEVRGSCLMEEDENEETELPAAEQQAMERLAKALEEMERRLMSPDSLMWYRGYAPLEYGSEQALGDEALAAHLDHLTRTHGTGTFVTGHSVQGDGEIHSRLDGRLFLIDTGMLASHYGGRPAALVIQDGRFYAAYPGEEPQELGGETVVTEEAEGALKD